MRIKREEMLALTRRMTVKRASMTRAAGAYIDGEGWIDGTFNIHFSNLSLQEQEKQLKIAKAVPFADTDQELCRYEIPSEAMGKDSMWKLLMGIKTCGLKNDALLDVLYEKIAEIQPVKGEYAIYVYHDRYDIPAKGTDKKRQGESEQVFEYLVCAVCPLQGEYEPSEPVCGFVFPAFCKDGAALNFLDIYQSDREQVSCRWKKLFLEKEGGAV